MADSTPALPTQASDLFQRDPALGMFTIVTAGNGLPNAGVVEVDGKKVMVPDWSRADWYWWITTCLDIADAMEAERPERFERDQEVEKLRALAREASMSDGLQPSNGGAVSEDGPLSGDDVGGLWSGAGKLLLAGGRLLKSQAKRVGKWAAPYVKKAMSAAWNKASGLFRKAPAKVIAGMTLLLAPDFAMKAVKSAANLLGGLVGGAASGVVSGLGGIGMLAIGAIIYFGFFHGKGE